MLTLSNPLSASRARKYHAEEFHNSRVNYYAPETGVRGAWHGRLALHWGLAGDVDAERFERLAEGQQPATGDALVRHRTPCRYMTAAGKTVTVMAHRACWDATFSVPKSVSLTALVGGDDRVREAHRTAVAAALRELEPYVQALGGRIPPETTGNWVAATFEHDSARPVGGYAAPHLHTHVVIFNLTRTKAGGVRPIEPTELYRSQRFATGVYRGELALRLREAGYEIEHRPNGGFEIRGYTEAYLDASSPRRQQIEAHLEAHGLRGPASARLAAYRTREPKIDCSPATMQRHHQDRTRAFGDQPAKVVEAAQVRAERLEARLPSVSASLCLCYAESRAFERMAVVHERQLLRDALTLATGEVSLAELRRDLQRRIETGDFLEVPAPPRLPGRRFTTREMADLERDSIDLMLAGRQRAHEIAGGERRDLREVYPHLNDDERAAVARIRLTRDRVVALEGVAGPGRTATLSAVRAEAERAGHEVEGLASTSRAVGWLAEAGIRSRTLEEHRAAMAPAPGEGRPRLYVVDESSLASPRQMSAFLHGLAPADRVLLVGDLRQRRDLTAGRPYQRLQEAGLRAVRLDGVLRETDPALKAVGEQLAQGEVVPALWRLDGQGRVREIADRGERLHAIAAAYVGSAGRTVVVSPDDRSRRDINTAIHHARQEAGHLARHARSVPLLVRRQDVAGASRARAGSYEIDDVVRYTVGSRVIGLRPGDYARVTHVDREQNLITVRRSRGEEPGGPRAEELTYDPRRLLGVALYREEHRALSTGERLQLTAPGPRQRLVSGALGTLEAMDAGGRLRVRLDSGRTVRVELGHYPHFDYGYAVANVRSQGQTADRVLIHIDAARAPDVLGNRRLAHAAVSRARCDVQIYTNDRAQLVHALDKGVSHQTALQFAHVRTRQQHSMGLGVGR